MTTISFPLSARMRGAKIAALQEALEQLGYEIPAGERQGALFGASTGAAVSALQDKHALDATGAVDQRTAELLARLMEESPEASAPVPRGPSTRVAARTVLRLLGLPSGKPGIAIEHATRLVAGDEAARAANAGEFLQSVLRARGLDKARTPSKSPRAQYFTVAGAIDCKEPIEGIDIEVVQDVLGGKLNVLDRAKTNAAGEFALGFEAAAAPIIRLVVGNAKDRRFVSPPKRAEAETWFEWSELRRPVPRPGAFELREAVLEATLKGAGKSLRKLEESDERSEVSLLAETTGISRSYVAAHTIAAHLENETGIARGIVFALIGRSLDDKGWDAKDRASARGARGSLPEPLKELAKGLAVKGVGPMALSMARTALLAADESALRDAVAHAVRGRQLSERVIDSLDEAVTKLQSARLGIVRKSKLGLSSWEEVLHAAGLADAAIDQVVPRILEHARGEPLWAAIAKDVDPRDGQRIVETLRMASLLDFDAQALAGVRGQGVASVRELARVPQKDFQEVVDRALAHRVAPAQDVADLVERLDVEYAGDSLLRRRGHKLSADTAAFLKSARGAQDPLRMNVEKLFVEGHLGANPKAAQSARKELLALQRVGRVSRHARLGAHLLDKNYDSAAKIAFADRAQLANDLGAEATASDAMRLHRRARAHYRATLGLYLAHNAVVNGPQLPVLQTSTQTYSAMMMAAAGPSWEFLFGSASYCDCEHCSSVTSPAAYLVDLLLWLQRAPGPAPKPYDELLLRRPDIVKILLNCENSLTEIPYIDLTCERLEEMAAVRANARGHPGAQLITAAALDARRRNLQTRLSAEENRAYPEHMDAAVYSGVLAQYTNGFVVPFDLAAAEMRAYLGLEKVDRIELMRIFGLGTDIERAGEQLAIVPSESVLITVAAVTAAVQTSQWGFAGPTVPLENFLRRAPSPRNPKGHISYDEMLALLACDFANPQRNVAGQAVREALEAGVTVDNCRDTDRELQNLTLAVLDRQHRLLRLAPHLPWNLLEIDLLLTAAAAGQLDSNGVVRLAACREILAKIASTPEELAFLFMDFRPADAAPSAKFDERATLYARLFLSRTDGGGPPAVYGNPGANVTLLSAERARICGALGLSDEDFATVTAATGTAGANVTFASLGTLYRHAHLARACALPMADFEVLRARVVDPFGTPAEMLRFLQVAERVRAATLSGDALSILGGDSQPTLAGTVPLIQADADLRQQTTAQLTLSLGAAPTAAQVLQEIVIQQSWTNALTHWLELDSRFGVVASALDSAAAAAPGQLVADLLANPPVVATLQIFARLATLVEALRVAPGTADRLPTLPLVLDLLLQPTGARLEQAIGFHSLLAKAKSGKDFADYFAVVADNTSTRPALAQRLGLALGFDDAAILAFWDEMFGAGNVTRNTLRTIAHYDALERVLGLVDKLGASPALLKGWALPWPGDPQAASVRATIRSTRTPQQWLKDSATVQDKLREKRRDALVRYLLATAQGADPSTAAELSDYHLIDVDMDDCMGTSRIVQANSAIQRFVGRCLRGRENIDDSALGTDHWRQWAWRFRYRLWEANRMVFLFPENFLDVARRSSATPLFRDFMKEVRQGDGDEESVRDSLDGYLAGLEDIANLDYAAVASNLHVDAGMRKELHVVARSRGTPQKHYHRKLTGGLWTPWEELAIGTPGRHLAMSYAGGTATLMWPTFADHPDTRQEVPPATENANATEAPPPTGISYLSYAWSTRDRKRWTPVQTSARALLHRKRARRPFVTAVTALPMGLSVQVFSPNAPASAHEEIAPATLPQLGVIELERDIVSIDVNADRRALDDWLGGDHQPHLDTTGVFEPFLCDLGPSCRCTIFTEVSFEPWSNLVFDDNRMVARRGTNRLVLALDTGVVGARQDVTVLNGSSFAIAPDATHIRRKVIGGHLWEYGGSHNSFATSWVQDFGTDAFAYTDDRRSFLCLSPVALANLAPGAVDAAGTRLLILPGYHAFATDLRSLVRRYNDGLDRLYRPATQETPATLGRTPLAFAGTYGDYTPQASYMSAAETIDFAQPSLYALYNWELFFHSPLFVAEHMRRNQRYEEAMRFYHYIFTPFPTEAEDPLRPRARYWVTKPFRESLGLETDIRDIIVSGAISGTNPYQDIEDNPFDAQRVAEARPSALQKHVVMRYLDNLFARGDSHFRRGDREDLEEAIGYYETARLILGEQPEKLKPLGTRTDLAFEDELWGGGANALVALENLIGDAGEEPEDAEDAPLVDLPLVEGLYFCVPPNRKLLKYYEDLDRRLYNARHCLSIDGFPVTYSLLAASIDPQALVDAAAAGVSVGEALAMAGSLLPPYRFRVIWAKAQDACNEVKALGGALLSALEKRDAEQMAVLRSTWEERVLQRTRATRDKQVEQSKSEVEALKQARKTIESRRDHYLSREPLSDLEKAAFGLSIAAASLDTVGFVFDVLGGVLYLIPNINLGVSGFGGTPQAGAVIGGDNAGNSASRTSQGLSRLAGLLDRASGLVSTQAGYARRQEEWVFQAAQARGDLLHMDKQIAAAELRRAVSEAEIKGHATQEQSWAATDALQREKFTNEERYEWMIEVLRELFQQAYQHAVKLSRLSRECLAYELPAATAVPAIGQQHWDSVAHGLLAGEHLSADLRELDVLQATTHTHTEEVTRHIALSHVAPQALVDLRRTGGCTFTIPRWWLQRIDPTFANRRMRSLSVSVPCTTGPYIALNATLGVQGAYRTRSAITLSTGINDFGVDLASAGEKYLPFEGMDLDVASTTWTFGFPQDPANANRVLTDVQFSKITDVVLHFQIAADKGPATVDGPPNLLAFIDLSQMDATAWTQLVSSAAHSATVAVTGLVPTFLDKYHVESIVGSVGMLVDGTDVSERLSFTLGTGVASDTVTISLKTGQSVDWATLWRVYLVVRMRK